MGRDHIFINGSTIKKSKNKEEFLKLSLSKINPIILNSINIIKYNSGNSVIVQDYFGLLKMDLKSLYSISSTSIKSALNKTEYWINKMQDSVLKSRYCDFSLVNYINNRTPVILICTKHNIKYTQDPRKFTEHQGCPKCSKQTITYTQSNIQEHREFFEKLDGIVYLMEFSNTSENFFKVGICSKDRLKYRINSLRLSGYDVQLKKKFNYSIDEAFEIEQKILSEFSSFKYTPKIKFKGYTECLTTDPFEWYYNKNVNNKTTIMYE